MRQWVCIPVSQRCNCIQLCVVIGHTSLKARDGVYTCNQYQYYANISELYFLMLGVHCSVSLSSDTLLCACTQLHSFVHSPAAVQPNLLSSCVRNSLQRSVDSQNDATAIDKLRSTARMMQQTIDKLSPTAKLMQQRVWVVGQLVWGICGRGHGGWDIFGIQTLETSCVSMCLCFSIIKHGFQWFAESLSFYRHPVHIRYTVGRQSVDNRTPSGHPKH